MNDPYKRGMTLFTFIFPFGKFKKNQRRLKKIKKKKPKGLSENLMKLLKEIKGEK